VAEPREMGRHEAPGRNWRGWFDRDGLFIRPLLLVVAVLVGLVAAVWRWAVNTPLLGSRLPTVAHVTLVSVFFTASLTLGFLGLGRGYRALSRWSQARRNAA
jgi:hypothetical protein